MNFLKCSIAALLLSATFVACEKEKDPGPPVSSTEKPAPGNEKSIQGLWVGHSVMATKSIPAYFSFRIKADGKLELLGASQQVIGSGVWTFNGDIFKAFYSDGAPGGAAYSVTAGYYSSPDRFSGTWGYNSSDNGGGFWEMEKVN